MREHSLRWGDLISPRAMFQFTLQDAWESLPTLFAMGGFFLLSVLILYLGKKILQWLLLRNEMHKKYILVNRKELPNGEFECTWEEAPVHHYGSVAHLVIESFFFIGLIISALFAFAIGDMNLWQSAIGSVGIGIIGTYVFGAGLQQIGAGYFFLLFNFMSYGEYWEQVNGTLGGRVSRITAFFVEFEKFDPETQSALTERAAMISIVTGNWRRNYHKEENEPKVTRFNLTVCKQPPKLGSTKRMPKKEK